MIVIADTTPLNYLTLLGQTDLLPRLFGRVLIPPAVFKELQQAGTPLAVRDWMADLPTWLRVQPLRRTPDPGLDFLDVGEREAIALAEEMAADLILLDETETRREASRRKHHPLARSESYVALRNWAGLTCQLCSRNCSKHLFM